MRYFLIKQNCLYTNAPYVKNWNQVIDVRNLYPGRSHLIKHRVIVDLVPNKHVVFLDLLTNPTLMYSERCRRVVDMYNPKIKYKQIVLLDGENMLSELYFVPILPVIDCLSCRSTFNLDHSILKQAILIEEKIQEHSLFWLSKVKNKHTVIRMDLAESLLRRKIRGIELIPVITEGR